MDPKIKICIFVAVIFYFQSFLTYAAKPDSYLNLSFNEFHHQNKIAVQFLNWPNNLPLYKNIYNYVHGRMASINLFRYWQLRLRYRDKKFLLTQTPYSEVIPENFISQGPPKRKTFSITATLNEYEPLSFTILASYPLGSVNVNLTSLRNELGSNFPSENVDIRFVSRISQVNTESNVKYDCLALEKGTVDIPAYVSQQFWITFKIPTDISSGTYKGEITIQPTNSKSQTIPLTLRILPYKLENSPVVRFFWPPTSIFFPENYEKMLLDMKKHGMTTFLVRGKIKSPNKQIDPEDISHIYRQIKHNATLHQKFKFRDAPIGGINHNQIIYYWDKKLGWFRFWQNTARLKKDFIDINHAILNLMANEKYSFNYFYHYIVDEPGGMNPENLKPTKEYLSLFKTKFPNLKTFVTIGGGIKQGYNELRILGPFLDIAATNFISEAVINGFKNTGTEFWIYNNGSFGHSSPLVDRFYFGFLTWYYDAKGVGQWVYSKYRDSKTSRISKEGYTIETVNGFISTIYWEMVREGIDDLNYIYTLEKLIFSGEKSIDPEIRHCAQTAKATLQRIRNEIAESLPTEIKKLKRTDIKLKPEDLDDFRKEIINNTLAILKLQTCQ